MNNLPLPDEFYRMTSAGAVGTITLNPQMVAGQSVTIDGVTYTLGTDFGQANSYQYIPAIAARGLAEAINGAEFDSRNGTLFRLPHPTVFALPMASQVVLLSRFSGTSGNSLAISSSSAGSFTVSGGTLSGGSVGGGVLTLDGGFGYTTSRGVVGLPFTSADQHSAVASVTDAPTSSQKLVITDLVVSVDTDMSVIFKEETSGIVICGPFYLAGNTTINPLMRGGKRKLATANKKLQVLTSIAGNISVEAAYYSEA